eukprot:g14779.t2
MREAGDARRGFALPKAVLLKGHGDLDDPSAAINEVLEDGAEVEVVLMDAVEVDDVGAPVASEWFLKAFGSGEGTKRRLNGIRLREEYEAKMASEEDAEMGIRPSRGVAGGGFDVTVEGVTVSGPLETPGEIRVAMEHDWRSADIGGLLSDPSEALAVKGLLQRHLPALSQVHSSRSGGNMDAGRAPASATMSFHDFGHTFHRFGIMSFADDARGRRDEKDEEESEGPSAATTAMRTVFENANRGYLPGNGRVLSRAQFLRALVLVARDKEGGVVEALREIVEETMLPKHFEAMADEVGVEIARTEVQHYISDNRRLLHSVYLLYAEPSEDGALITLDHFRELMDDCGVMSAMTATTSGRSKFDFQAETCFLQVQGNPPLPSMVFTEAIEASCRLAIMTAGDSSPHQAQPVTLAESSGGPSHQQLRRELEAIYLVLDCIIDLGLGDKGKTMPRKHGLAGVALVLALDKGAEAFTAFPGPVGHHTGSNVGKAARPSDSLAMDTGGLADRSGEALGAGVGSHVGRGDFISSVAASVGLGLGLAVAASSPGAAGAAVQFETERYGDKELKIATVNKLRQQIRNSLLEDPKLAPEMIKLAVADALGFDATTQTGGPDGSVALELDRDVAKTLKPAVDNALKIKKNLQRTNEMTLADVISMGGAEAIHACGGPPMLVQLGRYDEKKQPNPAPAIAGYSFDEPTGAGVKAAFKRAGLGPREMVLLLGAIGSVSDAVIALGEGGGDGYDDDLEDLEWQNSIPNTFGKESDKLGRPISNSFGTGFLQRVAAAGKDGGGTGVVGKALLEDDEVKSFVRKYAGNSKAFTQDLSEAYTKMTLLGERYETRNAI